MRRSLLLVMLGGAVEIRDTYRVSALRPSGSIGSP